MKNEMNNITELVFILDRSGSMAGLESDTIGGFNAMLEKQKKQEGTCYVSTVLFDNESKVIHDRVSLELIRPMTEEDYTVGGCTALLDAIGGAIHHIGNVHKYARKEDVPAHTLFVITTDGMENASRRYGDFLFIGANIDAVKTAGRFGIAPDRAVNYNADSHGTKVVYESVSRAVGCLRANAPMAADWSADINADYEKRGKSKKGLFRR